MMPATSLWICLLASITVTACAPVQVTYLKPSAPGAEYTRSICGETAGPKDRAVLRGPESYVIRVDTYSLEEVSSLNLWHEQIAVKQGRTVYKASHIYPKGTGITIIVQTPQDQSASMRFLSKAFFLTDEATGSVHEYQAENVLDFEDADVLLDGAVAAAHSIRYADERVKVDRSHIPTWPRWVQSVRSSDDHVKVRRLSILQALTPIPAEKKWLRATYRPYYIVLFFENVRSAQFRLRIPPVSIGATSFDFPEITFRLVNEWIVAPLNC